MDLVILTLFDELLEIQAKDFFQPLSHPHVSFLPICAGKFQIFIWKTPGHYFCEPSVSPAKGVMVQTEGKNWTAFSK